MKNRAVSFETHRAVSFSEPTVSEQPVVPVIGTVQRTPVRRRISNIGQPVPLPPPTNRESLTVAEVSSHAIGWVSDGKYRRLSTATLTARQRMIRAFVWWCTDAGKITTIDRAAIKRFFGYLATAHETGERWGTHENRQCVFTRELRPQSTETYFRILRTFFRYLVREQVLTTSPMETLDPPKVSRDQIEPFTAEQIAALLASARGSRHALRDEAIILFLLDTGVRVSELAAMRASHLNLAEGYVQIPKGKGGKARRVQISPPTRRALSAYLRQFGRSPETPVWIAEGGHHTGDGLTSCAITQLIGRLGDAAGITGVRCSPHTIRHTFAVEFVRGGGNLFSLMEMLGHTSLSMSKKYVALAEADIAEQHRQFSPVERMVKGRGR